MPLGRLQALRALLPTLLLASIALAAAGGVQSSLGSGDAGALRHRRRLQAAPPTLPACQQQLMTMSGKFRTCNTQKTSCTNQLATARDDASKAVANATVLATQLKAEKANSSRLGKDLTQCKANATSLDSQLRQAKTNHTDCEAEQQLWKSYAASNATIAASRLVSIQRLTALQKAAEERIAALEQQLNSTKAELNSTQAALSDAKSDLDSTIEDMMQLQADLEAARQQVEDMQDEWYTFNSTVVADTRKNLTTCLDLKDALAVNASACAAGLEIAQAGCEGMIEQLQAAKDANVTCAGALMICQSNAADLSWQVAGCDNRIAAVAADRDKYKADLDAAVDKLANCTTSTVGTDNDVITLRAQNQALTYELNDCQDELSQREQDYEHLLLICAAG